MLLNSLIYGVFVDWQLIKTLPRKKRFLNLCLLFKIEPFVFVVQSQNQDGVDRHYISRM